MPTRHEQNRFFQEAQKVEIRIDTGKRVRHRAKLTITYIRETPKSASILKVDGMPRNWYHRGLEPPAHSRLVKTVAEEFKKATNCHAKHLPYYFLLDSTLT